MSLEVIRTVKLVKSKTFLSQLIFTFSQVMKSSLTYPSRLLSILNFKFDRNILETTSFIEENEQKLFKYLHNKENSNCFLLQ